jgi:hypothetical protein
MATSWLPPVVNGKKVTASRTTGVGVPWSSAPLPGLSPTETEGSFRGVEPNQLGISLRVAALNLRRLVNLSLVNDGSWQLGSA